MNSVEILMIILGVIVLTCFVVYLILNRRIYIKPVSAGTWDGTSMEDVAEDVAKYQLSKEDISFYKKALLSKLSENGKKINAKKYKFMEVQGDCMKPKNINKGDIVLIEMFPFFTEKEKKSNLLKKGDVVYINFINKNKKRKIKLREYVSSNDDKSVVTQAYRNGDITKVHESINNHNLKDIKGIVRYVEPVSQYSYSDIDF